MRDCDVGRDVRALRLRGPEIVVADDARFIAIGLERNGLLSRLQRVLEHRKLRVGRKQIEIEARGIGGDDRAHRFLAVL